MSGWGVNVNEPWLTTHLAITGLGFGLLIAPITLAATESVGDQDRGAAAATVTASRMVGMTLGLAALTGWGSGRFQNLAPATAWPFQLAGETALELQKRLLDYDSHLTEAAMTLFKEFFLVAAALCVAGLIPCAFIGWRQKR